MFTELKRIKFVTFAIMAIAAISILTVISCSSETETVEVIKEVEVEKIVEVPGETVTETVEIEKIVEVAGADRLCDGLVLALLHALHLDLDALAERLDLLADVARLLERSQLQVVLHAPARRVVGFFPLVVHVHQRNVVADRAAREVVARVVCVHLLALGAVEDGAIHRQHGAHRKDLLGALVLLRN